MTVIVEDSVLETAPPGPQPPSAPGRAAPALRSAGWAVVGAAVFIVLWAIVAARSADLPSPAETFTALRSLLGGAFDAQSSYGRGVGLELQSSLGRVFKGFALAAIVGVPLGLLMGSSSRAWKAMNPIVQVLRPVSPLAWYPIWLAVMDSGPKASVWVIFVTALWLVVINAAAGAATIPHEQIDVSRVFRFGRLAHARHVIVPNALPSIVTGLRSAMGIAWMVIVAVEMMAGSSGIGFFVWESYNIGRLDRVVGTIVIIGFVGLALDTAFLRLGRRINPEVRR